ncbi:MAG: DUF11 domain-containing protein [bacterium]
MTNSGTEPARQVVVTDAVPAELEAVEARGGAVAGGVATWQIAALGAGEQRVLELVGRVRRPLANATLITNQAELVAEGLARVGTDDPTTAKPADPTVVRVVSAPRLAVAKTVEDVNGAPVRPGDELIYRLRVENIGGDQAVGAALRDPLAAELAFVDAPGARREGADVVWDLGDLPVDTPRELTLRVRVQPALANGLRIPNQATLGAAGAEAVLSDDPTTEAALDPTVVQIVSAADFSDARKTLENLSDDGVFRPGGRVRYTLAFTNAGDAPARAAVLADVLPPELVLESAPGAQVAGQRLTWALGAVPPGDARQFTVTARIVLPLADGTIVANQAEISAPGFAAPFLTDDPATPAADDPTSFRVTAAPVLALTKALTTPAPIQPGARVEYRLRVANTGDAVADAVVVTDPLPAALQAPVAPAPAVIRGGAVVWSVPPVGPGEVAELVVTATVAPGTPDGTVVANQAVADGLVSDDPATPEAGIPRASPSRIGRTWRDPPRRWPATSSRGPGDLDARGHQPGLAARPRGDRDRRRARRGGRRRHSAHRPGGAAERALAGG